MEGRTDLYRLGNGILTAIRYRDEILGLIVRPRWSSGLGFLLVHDNARPHLPRVGRRMKDEGMIPLIGPHARLT